MLKPADPSDLPALLRVPDLARLLGMTANGVRALIARGELPAAKLGRQWIVRRDALLSRLRTLERRPSAPDPGEVLRRMTEPRSSRRKPSRVEMDQLFRAAVGGGRPATKRGRLAR